jgi:hypothetical protein
MYVLLWICPPAQDWMVLRLGEWVLWRSLEFNPAACFLLLLPFFSRVVCPSERVESPGRGSLRTSPEADAAD